VLPRLTSLRAIAALGVFLFHLGAWHVLGLPFHVEDLGYVGVGFFFVLSGFVLAWGTAPSTVALTFYRRRFARVWPSHAVMLLVAVVVPVVSVARSWVSAIPNALLVQAWFVGRGDIVFGMNGPSWSLSCEAFFYATFPLAVVLVPRVPRWAGWTVAGLALLCAFAASWVAPGAALHVPLARYGEFLLGLLAGLAVRNGWRPRIGGPLAVGVLVVTATVCHWLPQPVPDTVLAGPFLLVILWGAGRDLRGRGGWLTARWMVFAGEASYAFYLVHELVLVNLRDHLDAAPLLDALVILAAAAAGAVVLHLGVEKPLNRLLRGRSGAARHRVPPPRPADSPSPSAAATEAQSPPLPAATDWGR
jgi:peptidoglycan/LPS O-acetylase OafA/YrhL